MITKLVTASACMLLIAACGNAEAAPCRPTTTTVTTTVTATPTTTTTTPTPTTTTTVPPTTSTTPTTTTPPAQPQYFVTAPSGQCPRTGSCVIPTSLPRTDSFCAANVTPTTSEPRPGNNTANHTVGGTVSTWGPWTTNSYWANFRANNLKATGNYTGVTTQIIQWGACKWGIDEDTIRAEAVTESSWNQSLGSDIANGCAHSFGLMQIRDATNDVCPINHNAWGGMPNTQQSTALNVDFFGAYIRSCYDGDFYDGGSYLYNGQTVAQIAATQGWDYVFWGCVGSWFSGDWYSSGAQNYINTVKSHLANRTWESY